MLAPATYIKSSSQSKVCEGASADFISADGHSVTHLLLEMRSHANDVSLQVPNSQLSSNNHEHMVSKQTVVLQSTELAETRELYARPSNCSRERILCKLMLYKSHNNSSPGGKSEKALNAGLRGIPLTYELQGQGDMISRAEK